MRTIYKYPLLLLQAAVGQSVTMPLGAEIRMVGLDPTGAPCIWAEVLALKSSEIEEERRTFWLYGTGTPIAVADGLKYVGSWVQGEFVWHLYEEL